VSDPARSIRVDLADVAALIERAAADLAIGEEPAGFHVALELAGDRTREPEEREGRHREAND